MLAQALAVNDGRRVEGVGVYDRISIACIVGRGWARICSMVLRGSIGANIVGELFTLGNLPMCWGCRAKEE